MSGLDALMNCLMSETVCVRLNLATIRDPSAKRNWMDVAGSDSLTPAQGVDTVVDADGCDVLPVAMLEGPAKSRTDVSARTVSLLELEPQLWYSTGTLQVSVHYPVHRHSCRITKQAAPPPLSPRPSYGMPIFLTAKWRLS